MPQPSKAEAFFRLAGYTVLTSNSGAHIMPIRTYEKPVLIEPFDPLTHPAGASAIETQTVFVLWERPLLEVSSADLLRLRAWGVDGLQ